jgi:hypothetical protein
VSDSCPKIKQTSHALLALRVAWLKCRARAQRWKEEVELLLKEMERSLLFCKWKENKWLEILGKCDHLSQRAYVLEGAIAYATEQAYVERQRHNKWKDGWAKLQAKGEEVLEKKLKGEELDLDDILLEIEASTDEDDEIGSIYSVSDDGL